MRVGRRRKKITGVTGQIDVASPRAREGHATSVFLFAASERRPGPWNGGARTGRIGIVSRAAHAISPTCRGRSHHEVISRADGSENVIGCLRWAAVLALVFYELSGLVYAALGPAMWAERPALLTAVGSLVFPFQFYVLGETAVVVAGALIAPRFRMTTAVVLAALYVPISFWDHVLSRVTLAELVLLQGAGNYRHFILEALGAALGLVYVFWLEKAAASVPPSKLSSLEPSPGSAGASPARTAARTLIRWLRWTAVLALVFSALGGLVYSTSSAFIDTPLGPEARAHRPALFVVVQGLVLMLRFHVLRETAAVVAGALIAPRFRMTTAVVLAALHVSLSFWGHVLAAGGPWWSWTVNYTHFSLEAFGAVLGVAYIDWSERAKRPAAPGK